MTNVKQDAPNSPEVFKKVARRPSQITVLNGDCTEDAFSDGVGYIAGDDQRSNPKDLRDRIEAVFRQIADMKFCACPVNPPLLPSGRPQGGK